MQIQKYFKNINKKHYLITQNNNKEGNLSFKYIINLKDLFSLNLQAIIRKTIEKKVSLIPQFLIFLKTNNKIKV